jgi:LysM repeat protein
MPDHARRSPARLLGPLALLLVAAATVFVIAGSKIDSSDRDQPSASGRTSGRTTTTRTTTTRAQRPRGKSYTVKTGDTLGSIAERTGVAVEQLLELNPDLDPQTLVAGQKIKLRE